MKTTIEIPDDLFREAKAIAARRGISLKSLVTNSLRESISAGKGTTPDRPWMKFYGCLNDVPSTELAAISQRIEQECECVDEKDWA
jgi:hypothetical protein